MTATPNHALPRTVPGRHVGCLRSHRAVPPQSLSLGALGGSSRLVQRKLLVFFAFAFSLASCSDARPFPPDWTARPTSKKDATAELEASWEPVIVQAHKDQAELLQKHGIDVVALMEERHRLSQNEWTAFLSQMKQGDELWFFSAPPNHITDEGYAIIRRGSEVHRFQTKFF